MLKILTPPRKQVALFSGYGNVASKGFANALSKLKSQGYIEYPDPKPVRLSSAGLAAAGTVSAPTSNAVVQERLKTFLTPKECIIFNLLLDGAAHQRHVVAAAAGYSHMAKGFSNALSKLSTLFMIIYPKDPNDPKAKLVQATDICFPFGRSNNNNNGGGDGGSSS